MKLGSMSVSRLVAVALFLGGCASIPPTEQVAKARLAVQRAEQSGAPQYAPLPLAQARDRLVEAERELEKGENERALRAAEKAEADAELAVARSQRLRMEAAVDELERTVNVLGEEVSHEKR